MHRADGPPPAIDPRHDPDLLAELTDLAATVARAAGATALAGRRSIATGNHVAHETKSNVVDPVTEYDRHAEREIVERLAAARPDDAIVGEEGADHPGSSGVEWLVDPIDGTVNFLYDLPTWSTSIAATVEGVPVAAAVYLPCLDEMFTATAGAGARVGDVPLRASELGDLAMALVATGFSYHIGDERERQAQRVAGVLPRVRDVRRMGSAAIDLAMVAAGRLDAYYEEHLNAWDLAAGILLVSEAGGTVTDYRGDPIDLRRPCGVVAGAAGLHRELVALLGVLDRHARPPAPT